MYFDHNAEGASQHSTIKTVKECSQICLTNPDCVGFDFDRNDSPYKNTHCWIHDDINMVIKRQSYVDHYKKDTCQEQTRKILQIIN